MDEIFVAGWLHDFGKVATPDHIMNKSTKLQGLYDKIEHSLNELCVFMKIKISNKEENLYNFLRLS